jgi:outer membrane autotransporter protein
METHSIKSLIRYGSVCLLALFWAGSASAAGNYYLKPHFGISMIDDNDFDQTGIAAPGADGDGEFDNGWNAGLGFGYRYGNGWSAEIDWEYRTSDNDSVAFSDGTTFADGDLASNIFYLNGYYTFELENKRFRPYVGAGLGWVEEIDLDLETGGVETSYSSDGDIAWQLMAGVETDIAESWRLQGELRYTRVSDVDLDQEGGVGEISGLDYDAWTFGIGVVYDF